MDMILVIVALIVIWQLLHHWAGEVALSSPRQTLDRVMRLVADPTFWPNVLETGLALFWALAIAALGGLGIGTLLGIHKLSGEIAEPLLVAIYALPKITLYPLILLIFGLGMPAKVAFGAIHGIIPIALFTLNAVRNIRPVQLKAARVMRLSTWQALTQVWIPATLPEIIAGQRIGFSLTLLGVLLGEMFSSQRGLGFMIMNAIGLNDVPLIMAIAVLLAVFAVGASALLLNLERRQGTRR
jgi:NitT/TauT family transport system permease protein